MRLTRMIAVCIVVPLFYVYSLAQPSDATVIVHQNTLNGFLTAIGPVSGSDQFNVAGAKGTYTWNVKNARIELKPDKAVFTADASVKAGPAGYGSVATGAVEIKYNQETNRISVKVLKASFEVYTTVFGKKMHISDVDISKYYRPEFEFAGPQPVQPSVEVDLPGGLKKTVYISMASQNLKIQQDQLVVTSNLIFSDKAPAKQQ
jgi:hypothetical protein